MAINYYEVLGVCWTDDLSAIKAAYRRLSSESHPDKNPGDETAAERFRLAAEAYELLSDPDRRRSYDRRVVSPETVIDLFRTPDGKRSLEDFLPRGSLLPAQGSDQIRVLLVNADLRLGTQLVYKRGGSIEIRIPPTLERYYMLRLTRRGEPGKNGGANGDMFLVIVPRTSKAKGES